MIQAAGRSKWGTSVMCSDQTSSCPLSSSRSGERKGKSRKREDGGAARKCSPVFTPVGEVSILFFLDLDTIFRSRYLCQGDSLSKTLISLSCAIHQGFLASLENLNIHRILWIQSGSINTKGATFKVVICTKFSSRWLVRGELRESLSKAFARRRENFRRYCRIPKSGPSTFSAHHWLH